MSEIIDFFSFGIPYLSLDGAGQSCANSKSLDQPRLVKKKLFIIKLFLT